MRTTDVAGYVRRLRALPGFDDIETVTGEYDLIVRVSAPSAAELDAVLDRVQGWPDTVRTTTWVILRRYPSGERITQPGAAPSAVWWDRSPAVAGT